MHNSPKFIPNFFFSSSLFSVHDSQATLTLFNRLVHLLTLFNQFLISSSTGLSRISFNRQWSHFHLCPSSLCSSSLHSIANHLFVCRLCLKLSLQGNSQSSNVLHLKPNDSRLVFFFLSRLETWLKKTNHYSLISSFIATTRIITVQLSSLYILHRPQARHQPYRCRFYLHLPILLSLAPTSQTTRPITNIPTRPIIN